MVFIMNEIREINWRESENVVIGVNRSEGRTYVAGSNNPWYDLALVLEGLGVVMKTAAKFTNQTDEEMARYVHEYLEKVENDYSNIYKKWHTST